MDKTLHDFQTQLSESFYSRIKLLEKLIGGNHWLTTGTYKEKVLINFLNQNLPERLKAKSGFIIFPKERNFKSNPPEEYDPLNKSAYDLSKQIDIIVYDKINTCPIYEDNDIILIAPEAVKSIIEVKGSLSIKHLQDSIALLNDFRNKWLNYVDFCNTYHNDVNIKAPELLIYSWEIKKNKLNNRYISGKTIGLKLANNLKTISNRNNYSITPNINSLYIYNDLEISLLANVEDTSIGYLVDRGYRTIFDNNGIINKGGDKTLFSLLSSCIYSCDEIDKNRFLYPTDENNKIDVFPHQDLSYFKSFEI